MTAAETRRETLLAVARWLEDSSEIAEPTDNPSEVLCDLAAVARAASRGEESTLDAHGLPGTAGDAHQSLLAALRLPLIFHHGGPWTKEDGDLWEEITGTREATTRVMCDTIRAVLLDHETG